VLRQIKARIPPEGLSLFSQLLDKAKSILANSLGRVFLAGVIMAGVALLITLFLKEVPLSRWDAAATPVERGGPDDKGLGE